MNGVHKPRMLLTGGTGLLALNWACALRNKWDVILATHLHEANLGGVVSCQVDLEDTAQLGHQLDHLSLDLIVHTVGLTNVGRCEEDRELARHVNAEIARNVAHASAIRNIGFIHISTDHLFAGTSSFYSEISPPQPLNEYGRSKLLAEEMVAEVCPQALILRTNFFGWGYARRQSFSDWIIYSLRSGKTLSLFDDVYFTPIHIDTLALAAHDLVAAGATGIFNLVGDERISKYDFGLQLAECFSLPKELIQRSQVGQANLSANRPRDMSLNNIKARQALGRPLGRLNDFLATLHSQEAERATELLYVVSE